MSIFRRLFGKSEEQSGVDSERLVQLGNEKEDAGDLPGALALYREAARLSPGSAKAHLNLGIALAALGSAFEALEAYETGLAIDSSNPFLFYNRALLKYKLGDVDGAGLDVRSALALKSDFAAAYILHSNVLDDLGDTTAALEAIDKAIALYPNLPGAHLNRARLLLNELRVDEALETMALGLRAAPDDAELHWLSAIASLLVGDFHRGWAEHEWRSQVGAHEPLREFGLPRWEGQAAPNQTVVLFAEQGLGDSIQFLRYVPRVAERAKSVVLLLPAALQGLARESFGDICEVAEDGQTIRADFQCPLLSLPLVFATDEDSIPQVVPYLRSNPARAEAWRARLGESPYAGPKVGLVCSGNPAHQNDANRSVPLEMFRRAMPESCEFFLLQPKVRDDDAIAVANWPVLRTLTGDLKDFGETAALMESLDVILTVDTSVAHLAGALGRPVWILLPYCPDWRWMLGRTDSPWYPTAKLYRQGRPKDWAIVLAQVAADLKTLAPRS
jgi:tetratricopeptide (TPR) repeat protein